MHCSQTCIKGGINMKMIRAEPKGSIYFTQNCAGATGERKKDGNNYLILHKCSSNTHSVPDQQPQPVRKDQSPDGVQAGRTHQKS